MGKKERAQAAAAARALFFDDTHESDGTSAEPAPAKRADDAGGRKAPAPASQPKASAGSVRGHGSSATRGTPIVPHVPTPREALVHLIPVKWAKPRPGDQKVYISDIRKAKKELHWSPTIDLETGSRELVDWVKTHRDLFD